MWWLVASAFAARPFLPLESIAYRVDVSGPVARVEVVETFRNTTAGLVDAVYVFPLAPGAAIDGLHIRIGTREIDGTVQAREAARATYEAARAEGKTAALTEEVRGGVFTQDVANLPPGEAIEVTFSVVQPVARVDDGWGLSLPLLAPPRFVPLGRPTVLAALSAESPRDVGVRAEVELTVQAGASVRELWAEPLPRDVRPDLFGSAARLSLTELPLTADLDVRWRTARDEPSAGLLLSDTHALLVTERGRSGSPAGSSVDWSGCPVLDVVSLSVGGEVYHLARRSGACPGPVVVRGGPRELRVWPRAAADGRTVATSWARARASQLAGQPDAVRALGLEYGIVTAETSFVAVDTGGPVHLALGEDAAPWPVSALAPPPEEPVEPFGRWAPIEPSEILVREEEVARGEVVSKEFLERIPTGRSYQSAVQSVPGVSGGNPNLAGATSDDTYSLEGASVSDTIEVLSIEAIGAPAPPSALRSLRVRGPAPSDAVTGHLGLGGTAPGPFPGGALDGALSGPLARNVGVAVTGEGQRWALPSLGLVDAGALAGTLSVRGREARAALTGRWDEGVSEAAGRFGSAVGQVRGGTDGRLGGLEAAATLDRVHLGEAVSDRATGALDAELDRRGRQLGLAAEVGRWAQRSPTDAVTRLASTTALSGGVSWGQWSRARAAVAAHQVGPAWALAPEASVALDAGESALLLAGGRTVAPDRLAPGADGVFPSTWQGSAALRLGRPATALTLSGAWSREVVPLVAPLALDPLPAAGPVVRRDVPALTATFGHDWARRWRLSAGVAWRPRDQDAALADDLRAPFVPGFLDGLRAWTVDGVAGWQVPTDPWRLTLELSGRWASAVDPDGPWWTREVATLALDLDQQLPLRDVALHLRLGAAHTRHDLGRALLPAPVLATTPAAFDAVGASPWQLRGALVLER